MYLLKPPLEIIEGSLQMPVAPIILRVHSNLSLIIAYIRENSLTNALHISVGQ